MDSSQESYELYIGVSSLERANSPTKSVVMPISDKTCIHEIIATFLNFLIESAGVSEALIIRHIKSLSSVDGGDSNLQELYKVLSEDEGSDTSSSYSSFIDKLKDTRFRRYLKKLYDEDLYGN